MDSSRIRRHVRGSGVTLGIALANHTMPQPGLSGRRIDWPYGYWQQLLQMSLARHRWSKVTRIRPGRLCYKLNQACTCREVGHHRHEPGLMAGGNATTSPTTSVKAWCQRPDLRAAAPARERISSYTRSFTCISYAEACGPSPQRALPRPQPDA